MSGTATVKAIATRLRFYAEQHRDLRHHHQLAASGPLRPSDFAGRWYVYIPSDSDHHGRDFRVTRRSSTRSDGKVSRLLSALYTNPFTVSSTTTVKAIATASGFTQSNTGTAVITIQSSGSPTINFSSGFTATGLQFNGRTTLNGNRLHDRWRAGGSQQRLVHRAGQRAKFHQ